MDSYNSHYVYYGEHDTAGIDHRLGPCELQDPVWAKMSALAAGVNKKRKKSETKPQAQINKCNNEKRRREQENIYIEELAELISSNFSDMSSLSVKPDKCAILQETVNQIRNLKKSEAAAKSSDPVQQGEVSSSRPTILSNEIYGPLLLEALEGFLFVVNVEGRVEHVTENVSAYIKYTWDEVYGNSIYNIIHPGDHRRFSTNLLPMTIDWGGGGADPQAQRSRSLSVRFLVKPPDDQDETVEERQQRDSCYESMHISSTQLKDRVPVLDNEGGGGDSGPYVMCVASRISHRDKAAAASVEQFTTKLDTAGRIIGVDASGVSQQYLQFLNKDMMEGELRELVPQQEVYKLNKHLSDTLTLGQSTSTVYRLQIGKDKFVQVQTKSKLFKTASSNDTDFIMATHSILGDYDAIGPSDPGGGGTSNVGDPLMTSMVNGSRNGTVPPPAASDSSTTPTMTSAPAAFSSFSMENDAFAFDIFPTSTFELDASPWPETARPESRQSAVTPVSTPTPRAPSSPATTVAQSPSPAAQAHPYAGAFSFSPLTEPGYHVDVDQKPDTKAKVMEETNSMIDSARLRNLLLMPPTSSEAGAGDADGRNKNRILKGLLNQQDEDDNRGDNRTSPRGGGMMGRGGGPMAGPSELPKSSSAPGGNNMLLQLLNEKSDDDDLETKAGVKKKSELLQQLLKTSENRDKDDEKKPEAQSNEDTLLRSLGFSSSPSPTSGGALSAAVEPGRARKRLSDDQDDPISGKRTAPDGSQVSSTGASTSKLWERNKMLASLLAIQPNNQQPIPHIPSHVLTQTPQDILPRISLPEPTKPSKPMPSRAANSMNQQQQQQQLQQQQQQQRITKSVMSDNNVARMAAAAGRPQPNNNSNYLTSILTHNNMHHQRTNSQGMNQVDSGGCYTSPATSSTDGNLDPSSIWENNNIQSNNDPLLSDILDQVMDIVPDESVRGYPEHHIQPNHFEISEKMAINIIQKNLMLCESAVKGPSSPTISLPGTPPAYSSATMSQNSQMRAFQPPPHYHQSGFVQKPRMPVRPGAPQYSAGANNMANNLLLQQRKQQQEDKRRLLQQQQQQELLIPSNATEMNAGLQNIDSLLNNTVAPNVSLQRSSSLPEAQLSPSYAQNRQQQQQQQPYSPHSQLVSPQQQQQQQGFAPNQGGYQQAGGARLSPQFNQQMSLRQAQYAQGGAAPQGQGWQQAQPRLTVQNPMLNAQLTGANYVSGGPNGRNFQRAPNQQQNPQQQQQQRTLNSPGTVPSRHSPYPQEAFPPPTSPNSAAFNQSQYLRLQRANSVPTATTQLPGGLGSPRPYAREHHPNSYPPIPHQHPMMYQQDSSQYCYDQTGLQLAYNGADRGRGPPHLQAGGGGPTSEFVRQELRAVVGARTGQAQAAPNRPPSQMLSQQQVDLESFGLTTSFEINTSGASDSPKLWGADMGSMSPQPATSRSTMEEARPGDHSSKQSSLLQKLLSE